MTVEQYQVELEDARRDAKNLRALLKETDEQVAHWRGLATQGGILLDKAMAQLAKTKALANEAISKLGVPR